MVGADFLEGKAESSGLLENRAEVAFPARWAGLEGVSRPVVGGTLRSGPPPLARGDLPLHYITTVGLALDVAGVTLLFVGWVLSVGEMAGWVEERMGL